MLGGASENSTATGVREVGNQLMELSIAGHMVDIINDLQEFHDRLCSPQDNSCISDIEEFNLSRNVGLCSFRLLGAHISCVEKDEPSIGNLTIMKFICSIVENKELHEKLNIFNYFLQCFSVLPYYAYYEQMRFQLNGIVTDFRQQNQKIR